MRQSTKSASSQSCGHRDFTGKKNAFARTIAGLSHLTFWDLMQRDFYVLRWLLGCCEWIVVGLVWWWRACATGMKSVCNWHHISCFVLRQLAWRYEHVAAVVRGYQTLVAHLLRCAVWSQRRGVPTGPFQNWCSDVFVRICVFIHPYMTCTRAWLDSLRMKLKPW